MNWYLEVLKKYAVFSGRARRMEYWMFTLVNIIISVAVMILDYVILDTKGILYIIYCFAVFIPSLAVLVRRLHDTSRSGWWFFISLVPFIGSIWLLVLTCLDSTPGSNEYGPNPKEA